MNMLKNIQQGRANKPPRILVYGTEGIGKTTAASQAPKPIFIQTEDGLDQIASDRFPLAKSYDDVYAALSGLNLANVSRRRPKHLDRELMILWLQQRKAAGQSLRWTVVCLENRDHALAIRREFGNWRDAIDAAGVREAR
jgi:hypothetical protein